MAKTYETKAERSGGTIRISIPASVANDLDTFKSSIEALAERLGCRNCFSGADCTFEMERDFLVNEKLKVNPGNRLALVGRPVQTRGLTVNMAPEVAFDLKKILRTVDDIGRSFGKHTGQAFCCSGFDLTFRQELAFMANRDGKVRVLSEI